MASNQSPGVGSTNYHLFLCGGVQARRALTGGIMSRPSGKDVSLAGWGGETLPASIWGVKDTNRLPLAKAPSCFESATTSRHASDSKLFGFFFLLFFFLIFDRSGQSFASAQTHTMSKSGDRAGMIYSRYTPVPPPPHPHQFRGRGFTPAFFLCLAAARVRVCDERRAARDLSLCSPRR